MDNGGYSCNDLDQITWSYKQLPAVFEPYKFGLQQFSTNFPPLQAAIDEEFGINTPDKVKLFGMIWHRLSDDLSPTPIKLDGNANTKRLILATLNAIYDIFGVYGPMLNRSKIFFQKLQNDKSLNWDTVLSCSLHKEWLNISKQSNSTPTIALKRYIGNRDGTYGLVAFTDASKSVIGTVVYIRDLTSNTVSFLAAKNKLLNSVMKTKTVPSLEFQVMRLGVEVLLDLYQDLCGTSSVIPIKFTGLELYTDSMVCLHWLYSYALSFDKMQKRSMFIMNRLRAIDEMCSVPCYFSIH
jgi:hypothetical protein